MVVDPYDGAMTVVNNQYCHLYMMYKDGDINEDDKHKIINEVFQICADSIMWYDQKINRGIKLTIINDDTIINNG